MDRNDFMKLFDGSEPVQGGSDNPDRIDTIRESLSEGRPWYYDVNGDGTEYLCSGARFGAGFVEAHLKVQPDGLCTVFATSVRVPEEHQFSLAKLCRMWNKNFKLEGLAVRDDLLVFETEPLDLVNGRFDANEAMGMALTTMHAYSGAVFALVSGADPWDLIDYENWKKGPGGSGDDEDDDDDDGGESLPSPDVLRGLLSRMATPTVPDDFGLCI